MPKIRREMFDDFMVPNYSPGKQIPVRGKGSRLWDQEGNEYIDFAGGIAVSGLGHVHPTLLSALTDQASKLWHVSNLLANEPAIELAQKLCEATFAERVFLCNSGGEANEAALKLVRRYAYDHHGSEKDEIIAFEQGFHGRTLFTVSVGGQASYREGFGPLPGSITHLPFNDIEALTQACSSRTCAVMVEPIQGEGGDHHFRTEFLRTLRQICDESEIILIFDEVQTGMGLTGKWWAWELHDVAPDMMCFGKKTQVCGFVSSPRLDEVERHVFRESSRINSTWGGNLTDMVRLTIYLNIIQEEDMVKGAAQSGKYLLNGLIAVQSDYSHIVSNARGAGLMCAFDLPSESLRDKVLDRVIENGAIILGSGEKTVRFRPPLNISTDEIDHGLSIIRNSLDEAKD